MTATTFKPGQSGNPAGKPRSPATREVLRLWIQEDVHGWRYKAMLGGPPIWRLNMLSDLKPN
jgi:hypothetical protein